MSAFKELFGLLTKHRELIVEMARRELSERYAGQMFGMVWSLVHPIFMMAVYVFVFVAVFKTKAGGTVEMPLDYTAYILSGLIPWMGFQESMSKNSVAITSHSNLVKQVVFPLEILPVKGVLASFFTQIVATVFLIVYVLISHGGLHITYLLLPLLFVMQFLAMVGVGFLLASIGAYFRDMKDIVQLFCLAGVYLLPIFYLPDWVPQLFKPFLVINPFSHLMWCYQDALYYGRFIHPWSWGVSFSLSLGVFVIGYRIFRTLKPGFGNML